MAQKPLSREEAQEALDFYSRMGRNRKQTARYMNLPESTIANRLNAADRYHLTPSKELDPSKPDPALQRSRQLEREVADLQFQIKELSKQSVDDATIKRIIRGFDIEPNPPKWILKSTVGKNIGVPTLVCSDIHYDEVVRPEQINHVNAFNRSIANRRLETLFVKTADLFLNHMANPYYDYFNLDLGGDLFSGNIHDELRETNVTTITQSLIALLNPIMAGIDLLYDKFKKIVIHCIAGNHGRIDKHVRYKNREQESFEWLFYQFLVKQYANNPDIHIEVADGPDLLYNIYNTRYLLTHGDQFKGGSGIAGALSPLLLGDARKRKRALAINQLYDFMIMGHWHQLISAKGIIVNGSVKGYDEYAFQHNFDFEIPRQAAWITHPIWGITARWTINLEKPGTKF
jgi:predicted phosphodiesterase